MQSFTMQSMKLAQSMREMARHHLDFVKSSSLMIFDDATCSERSNIQTHSKNHRGQFSGEKGSG